MDQVLRTRTISGLIFGVLVLGLLYIGEAGLFILLAIVLTGTTKEYLKITQSSVIKTGIAYFLVILALFLSYLNVFSDDVKILLLMCSVIAYLLLSISVFFTGKIPHHALMPMAPLVYPSLSLLLPFVFKGLEINEKQFWILIILLIWSSDSFAYLVGRKLGKTKLLERLSPKKTWEGFLGAGILTVLFAFILGKYFSELPMLFWLITGFVIWVIGTIGDLFESSIKRMYDVKDSGNILPGHGGFLDRFDSFIFVVPFIYFLLYLFKLIQ